MIFCLLFYYLRWKQSNICGILCFITSRKVKTQLKYTQKWFVQCVNRRWCDWSKVSKVLCEVCAGGFSLDDALSSGRPVEAESNQIKTLIEKNQCYTMPEITDGLKISQSRVENHLHQFGYINHFEVWVPHKLSGKQNLLDHFSTRHSLLKCNENVPYLKQIVTGDKKWKLYNNVEWKKLWGMGNEPPPTRTKDSLRPKKMRLCICRTGRESSIMRFWTTNN